MFNSVITRHSQGHGDSAFANTVFDESRKNVNGADVYSLIQELKEANPDCDLFAESLPIANA